VKNDWRQGKIDAIANGTCIVYETESGLVKEYPNGKIVKLDQKSLGESDETN